MRRWRIPKYYPGWIVTGAGGSGGSGTVQTDGVTIQGDGSSGNKIRILQVETDASLTGAGTLASTLKVAPSTSYSVPVAASAFMPGITANTLTLVGWYLPQPVTFSNIGFNVGTADNANNSDVGLYNAAGTLIAHIGAQHLGTTGYVSGAVVGGGPITAFAGTVFLAYTSASNAIQLAGDTGQLVTFRSSAFGTSAGGALPATITPPALTATNAAFQMSLF